MDPVWPVVLAFFVGGWFGVLAMALMSVASRETGNTRRPRDDRGVTRAVWPADWTDEDDARF